MFEIGQLTRLPLGYVGENGTRTISIDMKAWLDEYPGALIMIQVIRPVDRYKYPAAYTKTGDVIHWTVDGSEVMYAGKGLAQIALYNPDTKQEYKSRVVGTIVAESLDGFNDILLEETDPASKWVNQVLEAAESAEASKNDAANSKEEAAAAITIVATQKNEALIAIQNEGAAQVVAVNDAGTQQAQFVEAKGEEVLGKIPEDYTELSNNVTALSQEIVGLKNNVSSLQETASREDLTEKIDYTDGFFVNAGGWITAISPTLYSISDLIPIVKGQKITVTCALATPGVIAGLSRWTRDKEFVETIYTSTSNSVETMEYTAADDVEYLMICYHHLNGNADKPTVIVAPVMSGYEAARAAMEMLDNHEDKPPTPTVPYEYAAGKVLCIGNSLTSGAYYGQGWTGASIQQNYPYYLGRMLNCEVTNGGRSGWSASDWYRDYITTHNYADYDTVIIWLGTNYGCSAMPTDAEIEAFVPDASVSPETANQALYLIEIVKTIQAANPDCFILVCGVFASKSDVTANNEVVQQIAAKYGLHYVDTMELSTSAKPELHAGVANVHFGKAGNIYIANKFANEIRNIINEDPLLAEFGLTNRTN